MRPILLVPLLLLAVPLRAQAPRVTPAGDPSVRDDTIYALAVRPEDHRDDGYVYLLDDGIVRFEADGRGSRTYRQVIQILSREAAEDWGEMSFSYLPGHERLSVNWIRVLSLDGRVLASGPAHEQESRAPVAQSAPVYTDQVVRRVSIGGVAPGTILDFSYTTEVTDPLVPGDFFSGWRVTTGRLVRRSRLILDVPASLMPSLREENWRYPRPVTVRGGRRVYLWATKDVPKLEGEPFAAQPNTVEVRVSIAAPRTWEEVARWYDGLTRDRYDLTAELERRLGELVAGARTLDDSLSAVYRWVGQDFRYVSLSLGLGGYQPRTPAQVLDTRYGDCKDKATLFISLARRLGVRAWPVLLSQSGDADSTLPTVRQFDHMIAAVERPGRSGHLYLDLTAEITPYGELPPSEQGGFALLVRDGGRAERVVLPSEPVSANRSEVTIVGELREDGSFIGRFTRTGTGSRQYALRETFTRPLSETDRIRFIRSLASSIFPDASGDSLEAFDGRDLAAAARVSLALRGGRVVSSTGGLDILTLPIDNLASPGLANELAARGPRRFPIDVEAVIGPFEYRAEFRLTLPPGWRARLPQRVEAASDFGTYRAEYVQDGRILRITRFLSGNRGIQPPDRIADLIFWLRAMSRDDVRYLVLERS